MPVYVPVAVPTYGRLDVTPELVLACPQYTLDGIQDIIMGCESDRLVGNSYGYQLSYMYDYCAYENPYPGLCWQCAEAIINQVYGQ